MLCAWVAAARAGEQERVTNDVRKILGYILALPNSHCPTPTTYFLGEPAPPNSERMSFLLGPGTISQVKRGRNDCSDHFDGWKDESPAITFKPLTHMHVFARESQTYSTCSWLPYSHCCTRSRISSWVSFTPIKLTLSDTSTPNPNLIFPSLFALQ